MPSMTACGVMPEKSKENFFQHPAQIFAAV
jgi:hypothetical protein